MIYLAALGLSCGTQDLRCSMWVLGPWSGIESGSPALGVWSLSHWITREVPVFGFWFSYPSYSNCKWCSLELNWKDSLSCRLRWKQKERSMVVAQLLKLYLTLYSPMDCSVPGFQVLHYLLEFAHTHVHWVGDAIQQSHPLLPFSPALNLSQHQGLFQWVSALHQVAKVLEFQLQHQSLQWTPRTDFL